MKVFGIIYYVNIEKKLIGIKKANNLKYYYLTNKTMKLFKRYIYEGNFISFSCNVIENLRHNVFARDIEYINKIFVPGKYKADVFYDKEEIDKSVFQFLYNIDTLLFIDFEMTMPSYNPNIRFVGEIIQAGLLLVKNDEIILKENYNIKPTIAKYLNNRTRKFLNLKENILKDSMTYIDFYKKFKKILKEHNPTIAIWGKYDIDTLKKSYYINKVKPITNKLKVIDLNALIKSYYGLNQDPGLFKLYQTFYNDYEKQQTHDALEDALITYQIYNYFYNDIKNNKKSIE